MGDSKASKTQPELGPAPKVAGQERIRAGVRAALFGAPSPAAPTQLASEGEGEENTGEIDIPDRLGRFRVLARLGGGGMGVVYSAYDPELDRKVAIKLLRTGPAGSSGDPSAGAQRLQREAQAMARLNHPNVITVHEVGTLDGQLYVAMELVDGWTLGQWRDEFARSWREILDVFIQAGEGLAAAHAAGIVHRDFKPDNVLVGRDGRVRVLDFGLARRGERRTPEADAAEASLVAYRESGTALHSPLTRTGAVMGTPAYMSPEQHAGKAVSPRSDQFSFCVALWEALFSERPFPGKTYVELAAAVVKGKRREAPANRLPRPVVAALQRGLAADPEERFESMAELLHELRRDRLRPWKLAATGLLVAGVASGLTFVGTDRGAAQVDECANVDEALHGVWDDEQKEAVRAAIARGEASYAGQVWETTQRLLDDYAQRWVAASREVCAAAMIKGGDAELYQRRQRCLDSRKEELGALARALGSGQDGVALQAIPAASALSELSSCADSKRLQAWAAPRDAKAQRRLAEARARLGAAKAQAALEGYDQAIATAQRVIDEARELDDPATEAQGLLIRGQYEERAGDDAAAERTLRRAVSRAEIANAHGARAQALIALVYVVGQDPARFADAKALAAEASAVLRVLGPDPLLQAKLDANLGKAAHEAGSEDDALRYYEASFEARAKLFGDEHPDTAQALANLGMQLSRVGRLDEADQHLRRALATFEAVLGRDHPYVATVLANLAKNHGRKGDLAEDARLQRRALAIRRASHGASHPSVRRSMFNLALTLTNMGRHHESLVLLREGLTLAEAGGDDATVLARWNLQLGLAELLSGDDAGATRRLDALIERLPPQGAALGPAARTYAAIGWLALDPSRARVHARAILEGQPDHLEATTIVALADSLDQLSQPW